MNNIFDSHAHYDDKAFEHDRTDVLASLPANGVCGVINCGCDAASSRASLELAARFPHVYAACGVHPHECASFGDVSTLLDKFTLMWAHEKCVAVGEIGLDYHYDFSPRELQKSFFEAQIRLSLELDLPVIVHDREAHEDTFAVLKKYRPRGVLHCFSGGAELAREALALGMYIGLGGAVTFSGAKKPLLVAACVPDDRLLIETDCPYMTPVPFRGRRNDSTLIPYAAERIAEVRGVSAQAVLDFTARNARGLFGV